MVTDEEILRLIRGTHQERESAIRLLARKKKLKNDIGMMIRSQGGDRDDETMVFHDSIIAFVKNVFTKRSFEVEQSIEGYIYGISRFIWSKKRRSDQSEQHMELNNQTLYQHDEPQVLPLFSHQNRKFIHQVMDRLGKNCKTILLFWAGGYTMKEIVERTDYKSEGMVRKKKHYCLQELIKMVRENPWIESELRD